MKLEFKLIIILLIGFLFRIYNIQEYGILGDEQATVKAANGLRHVILPERFDNLDLAKNNNIGGVLKSTIADNGNGFSFNVVLHIWTKIFGNSDFSVRFLPLIFSLLVIVFCYLISAKLLQNKKLALFIALLCAFHPLLVNYGQVCRSYSMGTLFSLASSYFFFQFVLKDVTKMSYYLFYSISVAIALTTHYLTVSVFIAHACILPYFLPKSESLGEICKCRIIVISIICLMAYCRWIRRDGNNGFSE